MVSQLKEIRQHKNFQRWSYVSLPLFLFCCLFLMDYFNFKNYAENGTLAVVFEFITQRPMHFLFEILVMAFVFLLLLLLCRKAWIAGGILATFSAVFSYINYMKTALNGEPFFPRDILMAGESKTLAGFVTTAPPTLFWYGVAALVLWIVFYFIINTEMPIHWKVRLPLALCLSGIVLFLFADEARSQKIVSAFQMDYLDTALQTSNYFSNGFVGAFTLNTILLQVQEPEDYSPEATDEALKDYTETPATEQTQYNVIAVMEESFFDIRKMDGISFSQNPLAHYDKIINRKNCYSGSMYSNASGGGTVRPEFEFLTGLTVNMFPAGASPYEYIDQDLETYVSNYKNAGYHTVALHPFDKNFYSRNNGYEHLGFDVFYGPEEIEAIVPPTYKRGYISDETVYRAAEQILSEAKEPTFLFIITMQNHQAYTPLPEEEINIKVTSPVLSEDTLASVTTYTQGIYDADLFLQELTDFVDRAKNPTLLLFFGDHLPTLGENHKAYIETKFFNPRDGMTRQELLRMYSTPFLIYANRQIHIDMFPQKQNNGCAPGHLLNAVAQATGSTRTPYMKFLEDFYSAAPRYGDRVTPEKSLQVQSFTERIELITYDRICGEGYSN